MKHLADKLDLDPSMDAAGNPLVKFPLVKLLVRLQLSLALFLWLLPAALGSQAAGQQPTTAGTPAPQAAAAVQLEGQSGQADQPDLAKRQESFQIVWQTVNDQFYDAKFGGVDWAGVRTRYEPLVAGVSSDRQFHALLQQMLNELHQSHFMVIPREAIPKIRVKKERVKNDADETAGDEEAGTDEEADTEESLDSLNYKVTDRLLTGIGIDVRVLAGSAVVTRVEPGSTAARAGLRPGFVIKQVGGRSLDSVIAEIEKHPLWGAIIRPELPTFLVAGFINGELSAPLQLRYLDARNRLRTVSIKRERLKGEMSPAIGNLPAMYTEFESRRLPGGIGYIRFNAFVPLLMEKVCGALRTMKDAPGIILDLRGNQGGLLGMIGGLGGLLERTATAIGTMETRSGSIPLFIFPQTAPYFGPLVILIDGSTQSAGEMFAIGLREADRATLVGEKSAGNTLPSAIKKLPTGALFQYGFGNYETLSGLRLEGVGITPDITVKLSRRTLLRGGDPQLAAAIRELRKQIRPSGLRTELIANVADVETTIPRVVATPPASVATPPAGVAPATAPPPGSTVITIDETPAPPPPAPKPVAGAESPGAPGLPTVAAIFEKYLEASGGASAFENIRSRVSKGTVELTAVSMTGEVEFDEQAPNKSSVIIEAPGLGVMQRTFDGSRAWLQDPLQGLIRFTGAGLELNRVAAAFNKQSRLKELYPGAKLIGKEKLNGKDVFIVQMGFEKWFFDAESGLLSRKGNTYLEDYREVDGIMLPFKIREEAFTGVGVIYQLTEIKHNVSIDEAKFKAYPSCFTKP
jgi:carboxyl-terminal processing protease